jgi:hypothetical protein
MGVATMMWISVLMGSLPEIKSMDLKALAPADEANSSTDSPDDLPF